VTQLPAIFGLQEALQVLADRTDVLPAVGGATEDELRPDVDEVDDDQVSKDDGVLDEPWEKGSDVSRVYIPLTPLHRQQEHFFRYFQDGSMRSFFVGTVLEHDRQTPVVIGQVGTVIVERTDDGRLRTARHDQINLLQVAFSQISDDVRIKLEEIIANLGGNYVLTDIEKHGQEGQDLRARAQAGMRRTMHEAETRSVTEALSASGDGWLIMDGSVRFSNFHGDLGAKFGENQPPLLSVAKNFSKKPRFQIGRRGRAETINLWQLLADLPEGNRTVAFKTRTSGGYVSVWYVRLRIKAFMEYPLMGVVKIELPVLGDEPPASGLITKVSNALLAERTVTPHGLDRRWHAHLYPIHIAERCVKNEFTGVSTLRAGLHWPKPSLRRRT
jgi:hypothetical protein